MIDENKLAGSSKDKPIQEIRRDESNKDTEEESKYDANPSTSRFSILNLSNTSHSIQKSLKKKKKTLNDLIL